VVERKRYHRINGPCRIHPEGVAESLRKTTVFWHSFRVQLFPETQPVVSLRSTTGYCL